MDQEEVFVPSRGRPWRRSATPRSASPPATLIVPAGVDFALTNPYDERRRRRRAAVAAVLGDGEYLSALRLTPGACAVPRGGRRPPVVAGSVRLLATGSRENRARGGAAVKGAARR
jgi:hypothetical protein